MTRFKQLVLIVVCTFIFIPLGNLNDSAAAQTLPKGYYRTTFPKSAEGNWVERYHGGSFSIKIGSGKYAIATQTIGKSKHSIQNLVCKSTHQPKNRYILYPLFADSTTVKWSHHHIYIWNYGYHKWVITHRTSR